MYHSVEALMEALKTSVMIIQKIIKNLKEIFNLNTKTETLRSVKTKRLKNNERFFLRNRN